MASAHIDPFPKSLGHDKEVAIFRKKQVIFSSGDRSRSVFYIQQGSVKLTVTSKAGDEVLIAVLNGGTFLGESALVSGRPLHSSSAVALTNVRAVRIRRDALLQLLESDARVCNLVISSLVRFGAQVIENLANTLLYAAEARLIRALESSAKLHSDAQSAPKLSQQDLANMIGVTRQRANVLMKELRKSGIVNSAAVLNVRAPRR